ncbi:hypothetical protein [Acrocarpospora sp. B8E8]|uniref:hypothetical protein n=1 Tax=Acrocarpospora sp. B8E8 TaxID=3153572 RepID=UPI00325DB0F5
MSARIQYDATTSDDEETTFNLYVEDAFIGAAVLTWLERGRWYLSFRDPDGDPSGGRRGNIEVVTPMQTIRDRLQDGHGVAVDDIVEDVPA